MNKNNLEIELVLDDGVENVKAVRKFTKEMNKEYKLKCFKMQLDMPNEKVFFMCDVDKMNAKVI